VELNIEGIASEFGSLPDVALGSGLKSPIAPPV